MVKSVIRQGLEGTGVSMLACGLAFTILSVLPSGLVDSYGFYLTLAGIFGNLIVGMGLLHLSERI